MLRTVSLFYLMSMAMAFVIALWLAVQGLHPSHIFTLSMMAWPMSALALLARKKAREIGLR